jgi:hypothetical protein
LQPYLELYVCVIGRHETIPNRVRGYLPIPDNLVRLMNGS